MDPTTHDVTKIIIIRRRQQQQPSGSCCVLLKQQQDTQQQQRGRWLLLSLLLFVHLLLLAIQQHPADAFVIFPVTQRASRWQPLHSSRDNNNSNNNDNSQQQQQQQRRPPFAKNKKRVLTAADLRDELLKNPAQLLQANNAAKAKPKTAGKASSRTRRRVEHPKQQYTYASQKKSQLLLHNNIINQGEAAATTNDSDSYSDGDNAMATTTTSATATRMRNSGKKQDGGDDTSLLLLQLAKELGWMAAAQHCDPELPWIQPSSQKSQLLQNQQQQPVMVGRVRVGDDDDTDSSSSTNNNNNNNKRSSNGESERYAYVIEKPAGWAILGSEPKKSKPNNGGGGTSTTAAAAGASEHETPGAAADTQNKDRRHTRSMVNKRVQVRDDDGSVSFLEYSELDVLALLTPEELEEYQAENLASSDQEEAAEFQRLARLAKSADATSTTLEQEVGDTDQDVFEDDVGAVEAVAIDQTESLEEEEKRPVDPQTAANLRRIAARRTTSIPNNGDYHQEEEGEAATAAAAQGVTVQPRPSVVSWLKELKAAAGTPIRGGNFWTAVAGAVDVDDSGLVLLCPKQNADNVFVEYTEYVAVVGNGGHLDPVIAPKNKQLILQQQKTASAAAAAAAADPRKNLSQEPVTMEVVSRLRKGRGEDVVQTVKVVISERKSTCASVIDSCQEQFKEGIRGDPAASPFDRRARRRLIHCNAISVSSLIHDDSLVAETDGFPDDIAVLAERRNHLEFKGGSFLGRASLRDNPLTTAFREINGAADGFPGWTVDRYGDWLSVYHDTKYPKGPLPSIHDGKTIGVYYLESNPNRSTMGSESEIRPRLLEGRPAPDMFPVLENGVTYLVSLNRDLSTGMFLDQRPQRAWLARNCGPDTRVLNCFAHTGAFSVAAAAAGASTVSLDLSKKWLDRLPEQLKANGIEFDERHDCVYGDCFDWLARLAKRNEKYDIVILDPPSTSIGQKRKRWSIKDMDELVVLAARLVKKGGLLWTTTNSASMPAAKFARLCRKGLEDAGIPNAKLERIQPMPADFPSIGSQPVKNLVWRIP